MNVLHETERKLVNLLLQKTKLVHQELENKFNKDLITNFPQNHIDVQKDIISRNLTLTITLSYRRKKKWRQFKRKNRVIRTPRKSTKMFDFVEVALERSEYVNATDNRKHIKRISKDSRKELENGKLKNFSGDKEAEIEEEHTNVVLSNKIDREKDSSKLEIPTKDSLLYSEITRSNLIDQKRQKELSCDLVEDGILCNTSRKMALLEDRKENEKIHQGTRNLSLSQSDFPLVNILSSLLKDEEKVPILTFLHKVMILQFF